MNKNKKVGDTEEAVIQSRRCERLRGNTVFVRLPSPHAVHRKINGRCSGGPEWSGSLLPNKSPRTLPALGSATANRCNRSAVGGGSSASGEPGKRCHLREDWSDPWFNKHSSPFWARPSHSLAAPSLSWSRWWTKLITALADGENFHIIYFSK